MGNVKSRVKQLERDLNMNAKHYAFVGVKVGETKEEAISRTAEEKGIDVAQLGMVSFHYEGSDDLEFDVRLNGYQGKYINLKGARSHEEWLEELE